MADLDLAGIITRVCANLRLRFSKVSILRILTSGTKSATVTVDGVEYDLYTPTPPTASTTAPLMDGTASYGSGTSYARSNHVHPTDTSRQATLVSGTNIKTINSTSILGSGDLTVGGSTVFYQEYGNGNVSTGKLTIDGTDYEIWAYSQPSKATSTPLMDGTAAIGNSDRYAAENHVHPTDTSRQAALVSGTNIKTVGGTSLLGSGDIPITITMEDTDVDAAVEEAWPLPGYLIIDYQGYSRSITLDGTYGSDVTVVETEAFAENVVTVSSGAGILIVTDANGDEVSTTDVGTYTLGGSGQYGPPEYITVFSFIMPESDVTLSI